MQILEEFRHAARSLARSPVLVTVAVLSLALGIGANATLFTFFDAMQLRPLPFPEPERLVSVSEDNPRELCAYCGVGTSWPTLEVWRGSTRRLMGLEAYREEHYALAGDQASPERVGGALATAGLFRLLGVDPLLGRGLLPDDERPGAPAVLLLSHGLWARRFGADSGVIGRVVRLNGLPRIIIGVMPRGFRFPEFAALWIPLAPAVTGMAAADRSLDVVGRLRPGETEASASAELREVSARLSRADSTTYGGWTAQVTSLRRDLTEDSSAEGVLLALIGAGFVLLIACANLANLFLARTAARARELAVRVALGASKARIAGHLLAESVLLGLAGGAVGFLLSLWGMRAVTRLIDAELPFWLVLRVDWRLLAFTVLLSLVAGVTFGLLPALRASRTDLNETLKTGGAGATVGKRDGSLRSALVVAQVALAIVLLASTGLLVKSFLVARRMDNLGYTPKQVLTAQLQLQAPRYAAPDAVRAAQEQLLERLRAQPMVEAVATQYNEFLGNFASRSSRVRLEGQAEPLSNEVAPRFAFAVSPDYFRVMRIPVVKGRGILASDRPGIQEVALITAAAAARVWPGQDPVGRRLRLGGEAGGRWVTIVGVVADLVGSPLGRGQAMFMYTAAAQTPGRPFQILTRYRGDAGEMATTLRAVSRTVDADEPVEDVMPLEQFLRDSMAAVRFMVGLFAGLGALALALAAFGIYGVMSYLVARRTRELGIRLALGADAGRLQRFVVARGVRLALLGLLLGLPTALGVTRVLRRALYSVSPTDPVVFAAVALLLAGIAVLACLSPARRATRVDPLEALRAE
jgi:putative ABC transport system permease protein